MERLTERMNDELDGVWVKDHDYVAAARRLAAYEDTGFTPEEYKYYAEAVKKLDIEHMHDLLQAEHDGRLAVLPFKIGDFVYRISVKKKYVNHSVNTAYIKKIEIKTENAHKYVDEVGKTVFLTREEAEKQAHIRKYGKQ